MYYCFSPTLKETSKNYLNPIKEIGIKTPIPYFIPIIFPKGFFRKFILNVYCMLLLITNRCTPKLIYYSRYISKNKFIFFFIKFIT